jgi:hypothetical protein
MAQPGAPGLKKKPGKAVKATAKKKLGGLDRLWQEWKKRHPMQGKAQFRDWLEARPAAKKAVLKGEGTFRYGGYTFSKDKTTMSKGPKAVARREAGMASDIHPAAFGKFVTQYGNMDPKLAAQYEKQIREFFLARGNPKAAAQARRFVMAGAISGFDPRFLAAIAEAESSGGQAVPGNAPYNWWGWSVNTGQQYSSVSGPFANPDTAFKYYAQHFGKAYRGNDLFQDFGPYAASGEWEGNVAAALKLMGGNPHAVRWGPFQGKSSLAV